MQRKTSLHAGFRFSWGVSKACKACPTRGFRCGNVQQTSEDEATLQIQRLSRWVGSACKPIAKCESYLRRSPGRLNVVGTMRIHPQAFPCDTRHVVIVDSTFCACVLLEYCYSSTITVLTILYAKSARSQYQSQTDGARSRLDGAKACDRAR